MKYLPVAAFAVSLQCAIAFAASSGDIAWTVDGRGALVAVELNGASEAHVPSGVKSLSSGVFEWQQELQKVVLPDGVETIGDGAFAYCSRLETVEMPDSLAKIAFEAFMDCRALSSVRLPSALKDIEDGTFYACKKLIDITIPSSVTNISILAFGECSNLSRVFLPGEGKVQIDDTAFSGCPDSLELLYYRESPDEFTRLEIPLDATGGECVPTVEVVQDHNYGILPRPVRDGYWFAGWWTSPDGGAKITPLTKVESAATLFAHWEELPLATGGDAPWSRDADGVFQSGALAGPGSTWLQMVAYGTGTVSFDWAVSSYALNPLCFSVDGDCMQEISGFADWQTVSCEISTPGRHVLNWRYDRATPIAYNDDCGRLRNICWQPGDPLPDMGEGASPEDVDGALASLGLADPNIHLLIKGDSGKYARFREWAKGVEGGAQAVLPSPFAAASFLLGAKRLFSSLPRMEIDALALPADGSHALSIAVSFWDGAMPGDVAAESVSALFQCSRSPSDWSDAAKMDFSVRELSKGLAPAHSFTLAPRDSTTNAAFFRLSFPISFHSQEQSR